MPHELRERITRLHAALDAAGRPRDSVELTAGIFVRGTAPADDDRPDEAIDGGRSTRSVRPSPGYERARASATSIVHLWPRTPEAVAQLGATAAIARERTAARRAAV